MVQGAMNGVLSKPGHIGVRSPQSPCPASYPSATSPSTKHEHMVGGMRMKDFDVKRCSIPVPISNPTSKGNPTYSRKHHTRKQDSPRCASNQSNNPRRKKRHSRKTQPQITPNRKVSANTAAMKNETKVNLQCSCLLLLRIFRERAQKAALNS